MSSLSPSPEAIRVQQLLDAVEQRVETGDVIGAAACAEQVLRLAPWDLQCHLIVGLVEQQLGCRGAEGRLMAVLEGLLDALPEEADHPVLQPALLAVCEALGRCDATLAGLRRAAARVQDNKGFADLTLRWAQGFPGIGQRVTVLREFVEAVPNAPTDLVAALAQWEFRFGDETKGAERLGSLIAAHPDDTSLCVKLGQSLCHNNLTIPEAAGWFEKAIEGDRAPETVLRLARALMMQCRFAEASREYEGALAAIPRDRQAPEDWFFLGKCYEQVDGKDPGSAYASGLALCGLGGVKDRAGLAREAVAVRILGATGDWAGAEARYRSLVDAADSVKGGRPTPDALEGERHLAGRLRDALEGRDVFILCHGPSVKALEETITDLAERDDIRFISLNRWGVLEKGILQRIGRHFDAVAVTHPGLLRRYMDHLCAFLELPEGSLLITNVEVLERLGWEGPSRQELEARYAGRLAYFPQMHSVFGPVPFNRLNMALSNTLAALIPLAMLGNPQRIFVFGADGSTGSGEATHYGMDSDHFRPLDVDLDRSRVLAALGSDASSFDEATRLNILGISLMFEVNVPPVYNCSPKSQYRLFPRISVSECLQMVRS